MLNRVACKERGQEDGTSSDETSGYVEALTDAMHRSFSLSVEKPPESGETGLRSSNP